MRTAAIAAGAATLMVLVIWLWRVIREEVRIRSALRRMAARDAALREARGAPAGLRTLAEYAESQDAWERKRGIGL